MPDARPYCHGVKPRSPSISTASNGAVAISKPLNSAEFRNSGRSTGCRTTCRHPSKTSPRLIPRDLPGTGSSPRMARIPSADTRKLTALARMVVNGPSAPMARPPAGGPTAVAVQAVASNRPLALSSSSLGTNDFRNAPLAAVNTMSAVATTTDTTTS